ncbi:hypothetical protein ABIA38_003066 [Embleya sp. AB8]
MGNAKPGNPTLVRARTAHGWLSQRQLAGAFHACALNLGLRLEVSPRQIRRWESANPRWPTPDYQRVLEAMFGVRLDQLGFTRPAHLVDIEPPSGDPLDDAFRKLQGEEQPGWWRTEAGEVADNEAHYARLVDAEREAIEVREYLPALLPGLLQTYEYAYTVLRAGSPTLAEDEVIRRAKRRVERLDRVGQPTNGGSVWFIVHDCALRNPVGGWSVLVEQLGHLLVTLSRRSDVRLQVLPEDVGAHPGLVAGPFSCYDFGRYKVVYLEGLTGRSWTSRPTCLAAYTLAYSHLQAAALSLDASIERITQRLAEAEMMAACGLGSGGRAATAATRTASRSPDSLMTECASETAKFEPPDP